MNTPFLATASWGPLRDFCIFEERIRQNLENVAALRAVLWRRLAWRTAFLALLLGAILRAGASGWRIATPATYASVAKRDLVLYALLVAALVAALGAALTAAAAWRRAVAGSQYEGQCQKALAPFAMQMRLLPAGPAAPTSRGAAIMGVLRRLLFLRPRTVPSGEITFVRRLPRQLAVFLEAYRAEYRARRALRALPSAKKTQ